MFILLGGGGAQCCCNKIWFKGFVLWHRALTCVCRVVSSGGDVSLLKHIYEYISRALLRHNCIMALVVLRATTTTTSCYAIISAARATDSVHIDSFAFHSTPRLDSRACIIYTNVIYPHCASELQQILRIKTFFKLYKFFWKQILFPVQIFKGLFFFFYFASGKEKKKKVSAQVDYVTKTRKRERERERAAGWTPEIADIMNPDCINFRGCSILAWCVVVVVVRDAPEIDALASPASIARTILATRLKIFSPRLEIPTDSRCAI